MHGCLFRILQETVEMAQNVERLKIEFLKQMQSEEERMQEEIQALQKKYQTEHNQFQMRSESVLRAAQQQFERANNVSATSLRAFDTAHAVQRFAQTRAMDCCVPCAMRERQGRGRVTGGRLFECTCWLGA